MSETPEHIQPVPLDKAYRLLNHGPTVLVSARHGGTDNVMAAAWAMPLDFQPPKVAVVLDKSTRTRELVVASGRFALCVPTVAQAALTVALGTQSAREVPDKLTRHGVQGWRSAGAADSESPLLVAGSAAWLLCDRVAEPHNEQAYDLFIGQVTSAWADARVFSHGRWHFDGVPEALRTLHYVAGGQFFATGTSVLV